MNVHNYDESLPDVLFVVCLHNKFSRVIHHVSKIFSDAFHMLFFFGCSLFTRLLTAHELSSHVRELGEFVMAALVTDTCVYRYTDHDNDDGRQR